MRCFLKMLGLGSKNSDINSLVGSVCIVTDTIDNFRGCGQVKVRGQLFAARSVMDDDILESGNSARIVAIEGVKMICKRK